VAPQSAPGTWDYATEVHPGHFDLRMVDWTLTIGALRGRWSSNTFDVGIGRPFDYPAQVARILTGRGSKWDVPACRTPFTSDTLVVIDGPCALAATGNK
jgi:hypothetical protein